MLRNSYRETEEETTNNISTLGLSKVLSMANCTVPLKPAFRNVTMNHTKTEELAKGQRIRDWKFVVGLIVVLASSIVVLETTLGRHALTASLTTPTITHIYAPQSGVVSAMEKAEGQYVEVNDVLLTLAVENVDQEHTIYSPISGVFTPQKSVGETINQGDVIGLVVPSSDANQLYFTILNGDVSQLSIGDKLAISDDSTTYPGILAMIVGDKSRTSGLTLLVLTNTSFSLKSELAAKKYMIEKWK